MTHHPANWNCKRLKDVTVMNAASLPTNTDADYEFDYIEISNVDYYGIINPNAIESVRYEDAPSRARRRIGKNSIVISRSSLTRCRIGPLRSSWRTTTLPATLSYRHRTLK
jgi:hypothetical protein